MVCPVEKEYTSSWESTREREMGEKEVQVWFTGQRYGKGRDGGGRGHGNGGPAC